MKRPKPPETMERISRAEVKDLGLRGYLTGLECGNGHVAPRFTKACGCTACAAC
jgi:hypothetical protein